MATQTVPGTNDRAVLLSTYRLDPYGPSDGDLSFGLDPPSPPWKKVALAVTLLVIGSVMLFTGVGLFVSGMDNGIPLMVIGSCAFIPGFFYSRIAFLAWRGYRGYSISSIPGL